MPNALDWITKSSVGMFPDTIRMGAPILKEIPKNSYEKEYASNLTIYYNSKTGEVIPSDFRDIGRGWYEARAGGYSQKFRGHYNRGSTRDALVREHYPGFVEISTWASLSYHKGKSDEVGTYGTNSYNLDYDYHKKIGEAHTQYPFRDENKDNFGELITKFDLYDWYYVVLDWIPSGGPDKVKFKVVSRISDIYDKKTTLYESRVYEHNEEDLAKADFYKVVAETRRSLNLPPKSLGAEFNAPERFSSYEPVTYTEYLIAFMGADPMVGMSDRSKRVEDKPFEYIVDVWRAGGPRVRELKDGLANLGTQWLKWLVDNDTSLDENDKEDYTREPMRYFSDSFSGVRMFDVGRTESAFWKKPGYKELWLISMALAIQSVLDEQSEAFGQSTFLNVKLIDRDGLEKATGDW